MTDHLYSNGRYFGYSECCIAALVENFGKHNQSRERYIASKIVGYVPCASCAEKIITGTVSIDDLVSEINSRRTCAYPFIKMKKKTIEELEEDYKAYVERGKQKERLKLVLAVIKVYN